MQGQGRGHGAAGSPRTTAAVTPTRSHNSHTPRSLRRVLIQFMAVSITTCQCFLVLSVAMWMLSLGGEGCSGLGWGGLGQAITKDGAQGCSLTHCRLGHTEQVLPSLEVFFRPIRGIWRGLGWWRPRAIVDPGVQPSLSWRGPQ